MSRLTSLSLLGVLLLAIFVTKSDCIVGGNDAAKGGYPYVASVRHVDGNIHVASGSIISSKRILTVASVLQGADPSNYYVLVGTNYLILSWGGTKHKVSKIISHDFNSATLENNIAILELEDEITFSETVQPISLSTASDTDADTACTVTGWGYTSYSGSQRASSSSNALQDLKVKTMPLSDCKSEMFMPVADTNLCTKPVRGEGLCDGDSGAPLVAENGLQIGIASWGIPCATGKPDIYTSIYAYRTWLEENNP